MTVRLIQGDCLTEMARLEAGSVDMVAADLPYGTTACSWDAVIPFEPLWAQYRRVLRTGGVVVLTANQPFTTALIASNYEWFRCEWIWNKKRGGNFFATKREPLRIHESVIVFAPKAPLYNPQMTTGEPYKITRRNEGAQTGAYGAQKRTGMVNEGTRYPVTILEYGSANTNKVHPTQKPVALMEYLIRTYTNPGDTVLDNTCGSGTTLVAAINTGRNAIGIERDPEYANIARERIEKAVAAVSERLC